MAPRSCLNLLLLVCLLVLGAAEGGEHSQSQTLLLGKECSKGTFSDPSPYQVNMAKLLGDLPSQAIANRGFYSAVAGEVPDTAFGQTTCYGDSTWIGCQACLRQAAVDAKEVCQHSRQVNLAYGSCVLRFSDYPFFSTADLDIAFDIWSPEYVPDVPAMNATRWLLLSRLAGEATVSDRRLANGSQPYKDTMGLSHMLYGLVQCTRTLNGTECSRCLVEYIVKVLESHSRNSTYGTLRGYSCFIAYNDIITDEGTGINLPPGATASVPTPAPTATPGTTSLRRFHPPPPATEPAGWINATRRPRSRPKDRGLVAGAAIGCSMASLIGISVIVWLMVMRHRRSRRATRVHEIEISADGIDGRLEQTRGPRSFKYEELIEATNSFADERKLGEGGFGPVYKGHIRQLNKECAIKGISKDSSQGQNEFLAEINIISRLRHKNLVQLLGWCHDKGELFLVYELMPNGSLDGHLHDPEKPALPWDIRNHIILGVGSALLYMHEQCHECVIHRDIKPANVLLDQAFNAKLADFGLARLVDHQRRSHTTEHINGTVGYIDPEFMLSHSYTTASDTYSFGILIMEIVSGRWPTVEVNREHYIATRITDWIWDLHSQQRLAEAADLRLNNQFDPQELERLLITALWCTHPNRALRPTMRQAVSVLRREATLPTLPANIPVPVYMRDTGTGASTSGSRCGSAGASRSSIATVSSSFPSPR